MQLAGNPASTSYIRNLDALKARGVCMITIAHLFRNDIAFCVEGISPDTKAGLHMDWYYDNDRDNHPLTAIGVDVVTHMLDIGVIVDLTHSTPATREQVFGINEARGEKKRPVIFTHTGSRGIFDKYDNGKFPNFGYYTTTPKEISAICACDGVIGVIPEVFWLAGADTHLKKFGFDPDKFKSGVPYMVETIQNINDQTPEKDFRHISLGTDFDGFADAPADLYKASQLDILINALLRAGLSDKNVKDITFRNALRVMENGWG